MKGLRKLALATAVSAVSSGAVAELQSLDDAGLQNVTGQAGLTIDVESEWTIGEFAYEDAGFLLIQGIRMGGHALGTGGPDSMLDNLRLEIDVAGSGTDGDNVLAHGFSNMREIATMYETTAGQTDTVFGEIASGIDNKRGGLEIHDEKTYDDGDLVIHFDFTDGWANAGGYSAYAAGTGFATDDYDTVELMLEHAVDFRIEIDGIGLAASDYTVGSAGLDVDGNHTTGLHEGAAGTTTLLSQIGIQGYLGPEDLHIENNGNGFGADGSGRDGLLGTGNADSKITWSAYTKITDLDIYIDIAGVQISDMEIHNERGDRSGLDGKSSFDFAHSVREIYAVKDTVLNLSTLNNNTGDPALDAIFQGSTGNNTPGYVDGVAINTSFKGDIDINHLSFGDTGTSIGSIYITDMTSHTNWTISAH